MREMALKRRNGRINEQLLKTLFLHFSSNLSKMGGEVPLEVGSLCSLSDDGHYLVPASWLNQPVVH